MFSYYAAQAMLKQSIEQDISHHGLKKYLEILGVVLEERAVEDWEGEIASKIEGLSEEVPEETAAVE